MRVTCSACGFQFRAQRSTGRFCSSRCRKASQRARDRGAPIRLAVTRPGVAVSAVLSVTATSGLSKDQKPESVTLRRPKALPKPIVADAQWPGMYRLYLSNGQLTDMLNLARARDAFAAIRNEGST
jgi:hypothetical protein